MVYDFVDKTYEDFNNCSVIFAVGKAVYEFSIAGKWFDGKPIFDRDVNAQAQNHDFIELTFHDNPCEVLGLEGFNLDNTNYFGSLLATDPTMTIAISHPFIRVNEDGSYYSEQYISFSPYQVFLYGSNITYVGNHPTIPGLSGQAILSYPQGLAKNELHAIHSYVDKPSFNCIGVRIPDYLSHVRSLQNPPPVPPMHYFFSMNSPEPLISEFLKLLIEYQKLEKSQIKPVQDFLRAIGSYLQESTKSKDITANLKELINTIPDFINGKDKVNSPHQGKHTKKSRQQKRSSSGHPSASLFSNAICNQEIINALEICVEEIINEYIERTKEGIIKFITDPTEKERKVNAYRNWSTFIIDMGFDIGTDKKYPKYAATGIFHDGDHMYPVCVGPFMSKQAKVDDKNPVKVEIINPYTLLEIILAEDNEANMKNKPSFRRGQKS